MLKRIFALGAAALSSLTAGCGDGPATVSGTWRSPSTWSSLIYATSNGPLLVEVHGSPFGEPAASFRAAMAEAMTNRVFGRPTAFTANPEEAPHPRYRVVLAFNPAADADPRAMCRGTVPVAAAPSERITVRGVFCDGGTMLASVSGWVAKVTGRDDPRFLKLMEQLTRELFGSPP